MWTKSWLIGCLSNEIQEPGAYKTAEIGRESILIVRQKDGGVKAFYNICQHRGMRLVEEGAGAEKKALACRYHGWRYAFDGELKSVPDPDDFELGTPCGKLRLAEIPCEEWSGMVWYNMDPDCVPLEAWLGPVKNDLECYRIHEMTRTHWVQMDGDFNWKCIQDNFNESYHLPYVHPQTKYSLEQHHSFCQFDMFPQGHARMIMPGDRPTMSLKGEEDKVLSQMNEILKFWELDTDEFKGRMHDIRVALQTQKRKLGASKGYDYENFTDEQLTDNYHYTVFPNISFSAKPDGCIITLANPHPTKPNECIFEFWYMTWFPEGQDKYYANVMSEWVSTSTPAPLQKGKFGEVSCGPAIDQDVEIWSEQQKGLSSRGFTKEYLPKQEYRIRYFHENIDRMIAGEGLGWG